MAKNAAGCQSEYSEESDPVICQSNCTYPTVTFDPTCGNKLCVKAGNNIKFDAFFSGKPIPTLSWMKDNCRLVPKNTLCIVSTDLMSSVQIRNTKIEDSGKYTLTVSNSAGSNSSSIEVKVLDRPGPVTKATIGELSATSVTISWKPPGYDGGDAITHYTISKREVGKLAWSLISSECKRTTFTIMNLIEYREYEFRIVAVNNYGNSDYFDTDPVKAENLFTVPERPSLPEVVAVSSDSCELNWKAPLNNGGAPILGYHIQHRYK